MHRRNRIARRARQAFAVSALSCLTAGLLPLQNAAAASLTEIALAAVPIAAPAGADLRDVPKADRLAYLTLTPGAIQQALSSSANAGLPVGIDLFADVHLSLTGSFTSTLTDGSRTWTALGSNSANAGDDATLVLRPGPDGALALATGSVWHGGELFALQQVAPNVIAVAQVADKAYVTTDPPHLSAPADEPGMEPVDPLGGVPDQYFVDPEAVADSSSEASSGSNAYVDVLVLYTPAAAAASSDVVARLTYLVGVANQANANDSLGWKFRIVRTQSFSEITEHKGTLTTDLTALRGNSTVASLRSAYGADLVVLVGSGYSTTNQTDVTPPSPICGRGYQPPGYSSSWSNQGFSVWDVSATYCQPTTGAHEMGHNLTLHHDWANDNDPTNNAFNYAHGFTSVPGDFNTVMGYSTSACPGQSCKPIPNWSNPNQTYNGFARGMAESTPTPAYDAKALGLTGPAIATWFTRNDPFGNLDSVTKYPNGARVTGWALDADTRGAINVQALVDGVAVTTGAANLYRSDVYASYPGYGYYHGFSFGVPASGGTHTFCVKGINVGSGLSKQFNCISYTVPVNPVGAFTGYTRIPGGAKVSGWALDPDTSSAISVQVTVDGVLKGTVTANQDTPNPPSAWADWGSYHGFSLNLSLGSGVAHNICATGINVSEGVSTQVDCMSVTVSGNPVGEFKNLVFRPGGIAVDGWVIDPDIADYTSGMQVTIDGIVKSSTGGTWYTDYPVPSAYSAYGPYHSFYFTVDNVAVGTHTVCVTALNEPGTGGVNTSLGCKSISYTHDPLGSFTATRTAANVVQVTGWATDPDTTLSTTVTVTASGVTGPAVTAGDQGGGSAQMRSDEYGSYHAFTTNTVVTGLGSQQVCVTAQNYAGTSGANRSLGCVSV